MARIEITEEATWVTPCGCHLLLSVMGDLLALAKSRVDTFWSRKCVSSRRLAHSPRGVIATVDKQG